MDLLTLEVDGSLSNPYAAGAVAIWTMCLSLVAVIVARSSNHWRRFAVATALLIAGLLLTGPAQLILGSALYSIADRRIVSVGFWGGPPIWVAPLVSLSAGLLVWVRSRPAT